MLRYKLPVGISGKFATCCIWAQTRTIRS